MVLGLGAEKNVGDMVSGGEEPLVGSVVYKLVASLVNLLRKKASLRFW